MNLKEAAAQNLFDNRLGWSDGRNPYAPRELWYELGVALYGKDDSRVKELDPATPDTPNGNERPFPV